MVGGLKEAQPADAVAQEVIDAIKADAENQVGRQFATYQAVSYATQVVAGTNYFVKVNTGDNFVHLRVYKDLAGATSLHSFQDNKTAEDAIAYF
eukprot:CAMPEP_0184346588 /NCGR_PEP_ID=MMETSP1089-20130417/14823_1 /TAXON_ID=38269 ORGANISM="Gloeochaete wittrockiana, Strain SAG46.84" /NCGR_SAMPLE_ID=MMETSP1089 /ASSEMBLY_ACC=CAM_ASM_000445 /LENGTH=93 /DNA_ID=CAMNT_0026677317 /DNA_START=39 /DNA_END=320 /DNA_ORIENTATION=+